MTLALTLPLTFAQRLQAACKLAPAPEQKRALCVRRLALLSELGDAQGAAAVRGTLLRWPLTTPPSAD